MFPEIRHQAFRHQRAIVSRCKRLTAHVARQRTHRLCQSTAWARQALDTERPACPFARITSFPDALLLIVGAPARDSIPKSGDTGAPCLLEMTGNRDAVAPGSTRRGLPTPGRPHAVPALAPRIGTDGNFVPAGKRRLHVASDVSDEFVHTFRRVVVHRSVSIRDTRSVIGHRAKRRSRQHLSRFAGRLACFASHCPAKSRHHVGHHPQRKPRRCISIPIYRSW